MGLRNRNAYKEEQCFFVTTTCFGKMKLLAVPGANNIVANSLNFLTGKYSCHILSYVIMPNHIHLILYFDKENRLSDFMRDLKKFTSVHIRQLIDKYGERQLLDKLRFDSRGQKFKVWTDRFDDVYIARKDILLTKLDYIHNNPLQEHWQLAALPEDYPYSSAAFYEYGRTSGVIVTNYAEFI